MISINRIDVNFACTELHALLLPLAARYTLTYQTPSIGLISPTISYGTAFLAAHTLFSTELAIRPSLQSVLLPPHIKPSPATTQPITNSDSTQPDSSNH